MFGRFLMLFYLNLSVQLWSLQSSDPITLSGNIFDDFIRPKIAANERGEAAVIWTARLKGDEAVQASFNIGNSGWSNPETLSFWDNWPNDIRSKRVVVDPMGNTFLYWESSFQKSGEKDETPYSLYAKKTSDEFWISPIFVKQGYGRAVRLLDDGKIVIIGEKDDFGKIVETEKKIPYQCINTFTSHYSFFSDNSVFLNSKGDGIYIGEKTDWDENYREIRALTCSWYCNGVWSPSQCIYRLSKQETIYPIGAVSSKETGVNLGAIAWIKYNSGDWSKRKIQVVTYINDHWSSPEDITDEDQNAYVYGSEIVMNPQGDLLVVWSKEKGDEYWICSAYKPINQKWRPLPPLPVNGDFDSLTLKNDKSGHFVMIWQDTGSKPSLAKLKRIRAQHVYGAVFSSHSQTWSTLCELSPPALSCSSPSLALTKEGRGLITWVASNGFEKGVQVAELTYEVAE